MLLKGVKTWGGGGENGKVYETIKKRSSLLADHTELKNMCERERERERQCVKNMGVKMRGEGGGVT